MSTWAASGDYERSKKMSSEDQKKFVVTLPSSGITINLILNVDLPEDPADPEVRKLATDLTTRAAKTARDSGRGSEITQGTLNSWYDDIEYTIVARILKNQNKFISSITMASMFNEMLNIIVKEKRAKIVDGCVTEEEVNTDRGREKIQSTMGTIKLELTDEEEEKLSNMIYTNKQLRCWENQVQYLRRKKEIISMASGQQRARDNRKRIRLCEGMEI